tara:strand:+ start:3180 stop:3623 length:444 start_codon:yes stop_codon:yes gene_type:complete
MHNLPILDTKQVSEMFAIPVRRLTAFAELQIVDHHDQRPGTGTTRRYSIANLLMTKLAWNLQALGVAPKKLSRKAELLNHGIARYLSEPNPSRYMSLWVASDAEIKVSWHTSTNFPYTTSILIDLKMLHDDVMDALNKQSDILCQMK